MDRRDPKIIIKIEDRKMKLLFLENYLTMIKNSVGTKMFRNLYVEVDGGKKDITGDGNLSCAFFVSSLLVVSKLIKEPHATVDGTIKDLQTSGWQEIVEPKIGCILVWEKVDFGGSLGEHKHVGFYIGNNRAVSNDSKESCPKEHDYLFDGSRQIEKMFWHPKLES
jgi:hypothetical protein